MESCLGVERVTDVLLRQVDGGGEIFIEAGLLLLSEGLETAAFLSLFGGNDQDSGDSKSDQQWWPNLSETIPSRCYRSETGFLLKSLPAVPANLRRVEQAAGRDLAWMQTDGLVKSINVTATIPALNKVVVNVTLVTLTKQIQLSFG
jgi:phage gp46-like protein